MSKPYIIAHRGASYLTNEENTLHSFEKAIELNADVIELDVRQTLDKELIIYHDECLSDIPVRAMTHKEIQAECTKKHIQIPTLAEALQLCKNRTHLLIELKDVGYEKRALNLINAHLTYDQYSIQSFLDVVVRRIKKIDEHVHTGLLIGLKEADLRIRFNEYFPVRRLKECHADFVSVHYLMATPDFLFRVQHAGFPVYVWTVDDAKVISQLLELDATGIITNRPEMGLYLRKRHQHNVNTQMTRLKNTYSFIHKLVPKKKPVKKNSTDSIAESLSSASEGEGLVSLPESTEE